VFTLALFLSVKFTSLRLPLMHLFQAEAGGSPALIAKGFGSGQSGSEQFEMLVPDNKVWFQCLPGVELFHLLN
jgi:hypothetical protein